MNKNDLGCLGFVCVLSGLLFFGWPALVVGAILCLAAANDDRK